MTELLLIAIGSALVNNVDGARTFLIWLEASRGCLSYSIKYFNTVIFLRQHHRPTNIVLFPAEI